MEKKNPNMGLLISTMYEITKNLINKDGSVDEGTVKGYTASIVLDESDDRLFDIYKRDHERLRLDMDKALENIESINKFSRKHDKSYLTSPNGEKITGIVAYDSKSMLPYIVSDPHGTGLTFKNV